MLKVAYDFKWPAHSVDICGQIGQIKRSVVGEITDIIHVDDNVGELDKVEALFAFTLSIETVDRYNGNLKNRNRNKKTKKKHIFENKEVPIV